MRPQLESGSPGPHRDRPISECQLSSCGQAVEPTTSSDLWNQKGSSSQLISRRVASGTIKLGTLIDLNTCAIESHVELEHPVALSRTHRQALVTPEPPPEALILCAARCHKVGTQAVSPMLPKEAPPEFHILGGHAYRIVAGLATAGTSCVEKEPPTHARENLPQY